jgi:hypothetical protein
MPGLGPDRSVHEFMYKHVEGAHLIAKDGRNELRHAIVGRFLTPTLPMNLFSPRFSRDHADGNPVLTRRRGGSGAPICLNHSLISAIAASSHRSRVLCLNTGVGGAADSRGGRFDARPFAGFGCCCLNARAFAGFIGGSFRNIAPAQICLRPGLRGCRDVAIPAVARGAAGQHRTERGARLGGCPPVMPFESPPSGNAAPLTDDCERYRLRYYS